MQQSCFCCYISKGYIMEIAQKKLKGKQENKRLLVGPNFGQRASSIVSSSWSLLTGLVFCFLILLYSSSYILGRVVGLNKIITNSARAEALALA